MLRIHVGGNVRQQFLVLAKNLGGTTDRRVLERACSGGAGDGV